MHSTKALRRCLVCQFKGLQYSIYFIPGRDLAGKKPSVSPEVICPRELCDTQMISVGITYYPTVQDLPCAFFRAHVCGIARFAVAFPSWRSCPPHAGSLLSVRQKVASLLGLSRQTLDKKGSRVRSVNDLRLSSERTLVASSRSLYFLELSIPVDN